MSLYLEVRIGAERYLLDAARILEIRPIARDGAVYWQDRAATVVDLRQLFEESAAAPGCVVLYGQTSGDAAALLVDRADGLVERGDADFCPLPPIGPVGLLIDAMSTRSGEDANARPMLRLRGERALSVAAACGVAGVPAPATAAGDAITAAVPAR